MSPLSRLVSHRLLLALGVSAALLPATAAAAGNPVIRDCTDDGRLSKKYTAQQYSDALKNIPTDVDEYTDCRDVIRREQLKNAGGSNSNATNGNSSSGGATGTGGGGGSTGGGSSDAGSGGSSAGTADEALQSASAAEKAAIDEARDAGVATPIQVGNESLTPEQLKATDLGDLSTVPTPLLIVLGLLVLATISGAGTAILSRVRARRSSSPA